MINRVSRLDWKGGWIIELVDWMVRGLNNRVVSWLDGKRGWIMELVD